MFFNVHWNPCDSSEIAGIVYVVTCAIANHTKRMQVPLPAPILSFCS